MTMNANPSEISNPGQWIEERCRDLGVSVHQIAKESGVHRNTISRWKRGDTKRPYWDTFESVRKVLDGYWDRQIGRGA